MPTDHVLYASPSWGVHDLRWTSALESCGFAVQVVRAGPGLRRAVERLTPLDAPVFAGPLVGVTPEVLNLGRRVVGLSWGFDLQPGHVKSVDPDELAWLPSLDALIVDSPSNRRLAINLGLDDGRIHLIPWGIDLAAFEPVGHTFDHGFPIGSRVVLSLRAHEAVYRTGDVIEAFALAATADDRIVLILGGEGPLLESHRRRIRELGLEQRVLLTGNVPEDTIASMMRSSDVYVTAAETDGTSVTLLQAMACEVPVVASNTPGNDWWVQEGETGRTFPVGDIGALSDLMLTVRRHEAQLARAHSLVCMRADWSANVKALRAIVSGES